MAEPQRLDTGGLEASVFRKLLWRIGAFSGLLFFFNWLDRNNVGFAALQMNRELGFGPAVYGLGAGIFFVGFAIFQLPSNMALHRVGARIWLAVIMIAWGVICAACGAVQTKDGFYALRFLLGAAEAGFTPGVVLYFSRWFPPRQRARALSLLFATPLLAPVIGGPISGWLMQALDKAAGFSGWRWMFALEGLPAVLLGVLCLGVLTERPERAAWLTDAEKAWLAKAMTADAGPQPPSSHASVREFITDGRIWALTAVYFFWSMSAYGIVFWLPLMISAATGFTPLQVGFVNAVPFIFGIVGLVGVARWSDRTGERKRPILLFGVVSALALVGAAVASPSPIASYVLICLAAFCIWGQQAVFWTLPSSYLTGAAAAAGMAVVNMGAALGGFVSPPAIGLIKENGGSYAVAMAALGAAALVAAAVVAAMRIEPLQPPARLAPAKP